jgi:hypothetical protein
LPPYATGMRSALLVLGASSLALVAVVALTLRDRTTMLASDCSIADCAEPAGPEGMIVFALVAGLAVLRAVAEARRR